MNVSRFILALLGALIAAVSQIILKKAAVKNKEQPFLKKFLNFPVIGGYSLMLISSVIGFMVLDKLEVRYAVPAGATGFLWTFLSSYYIFHERPNRNQVIGTAIVFLGIVLMCF